MKNCKTKTFDTTTTITQYEAEDLKIERKNLSNAMTTMTTKEPRQTTRLSDLGAS